MSNDNGETPEEQQKIKQKERNLLTVSTVILMIISVFNVFIVGFAGVAQDKDTALTSSSTTTSS